MGLSRPATSRRHCRRRRACCCIRSRPAPSRPPPRSAAWSACRPARSTASTRCRSATWKTATTMRPSTSSTPCTNAGIEGERDVSMPGGESADQVLDRYLPVLTELRTRYLDDDELDRGHRRRQPRRGDPAGCRDVGRRAKQFRARPSPGQHRVVVLTPITDGRWSCEQWGTQPPPFAPVADAGGVDRRPDGLTGQTARAAEGWPRPRAHSRSRRRRSR